MPMQVWFPLDRKINKIYFKVPARDSTPVAPVVASDVRTTSVARVTVRLRLCYQTQREATCQPGRCSHGRGARLRRASLPTAQRRPADERTIRSGHGEREGRQVRSRSEGGTLRSGHREREGD